MFEFLKRNKPKYRVVKITLGYIPQKYNTGYDAWAGLSKRGDTWTSVEGMTKYCLVETRKDANLIIEEYSLLTEDY
jgi:hypothetical protein